MLPLECCDFYSWSPAGPPVTGPHRCAQQAHYTSHWVLLETGRRVACVCAAVYVWLSTAGEEEKLCGGEEVGRGGSGEEAGTYRGIWSPRSLFPPQIEPGGKSKPVVPGNRAWYWSVIVLLNGIGMWCWANRAFCAHWWMELCWCHPKWKRSSTAGNEESL